jgi:hypothetical protein
MTEDDRETVTATTRACFVGSSGPGWRLAMLCLVLFWCHTRTNQIGCAIVIESFIGRLEVGDTSAT